MATEAYILIQGFEGTSKKAGHPAKSSIVHAVSHGVVTPVDSTHGAMTGRRNHQQLVVELVIDASVYQFYQSLIDKDKDGSKRLTVQIGFFRPNQDNIGLWGAGEQKVYFTIDLADAIITSVEFVQPDARAQGGAAANRSEYLRVSFVYRQITWTYANGNKATVDAWDK